MGESGYVLRGFGERVSQLRKKKGLSQERLGFECNLSQTYISEVEAGKRNVSLVNIHGLAKALGITLAELLDGVG